VTDAALVLGYLDPDYFLGGEMRLDLNAARAAIEREVSVPLGIGLYEAAASVLTLATERMVQAITAITVGQGVDPRQAVLVGGGGAAGLNAVAIARRLGCKGVLIPESGAALSAAGALMIGLAAEFSAALFVATDRFDFASAKRALSRLSEQADDFLARAGANGHRGRLDFTAEARHAHQVWEIDVPLEDNRLASDADVERFAEQFRRRHEEIYAVRDEQSPVHVIGLRARVSSSVGDGIESAWLADAGPESSLRRGTREMYFPGAGATQGNVLALAGLAPTDVVRGPAVIESEFTTIVVDPDASARRLTGGSVLIEP
jgi:N-methylhydantoinase A